MGWVSGQHHAPAALPPGKTRYPLYRRLGGPQGRSFTGAENLAFTGIRSLDLSADAFDINRKQKRTDRWMELQNGGYICILHGVHVFLVGNKNSEKFCKRGRSDLCVGKGR